MKKRRDFCMVTNEKIEKKKDEIARAEAKLTDIKDRLREKKHELITLENEEIVAMFRRKVITEDDLAALMRLRQEDDAYDDGFTEKGKEGYDAIET